MTTPAIWWLRRDLRLAENPALRAACEAGPVIPVWILDPVHAEWGPAFRMRAGASLACLADDLAKRGSRLILRRGEALATLRALIAETGAASVHWTRLYEPDAQARDTEAKAALKADGIDATSHKGAVLFEPWEVETKSGGPYRVYSPYWKAVRDREVPSPAPAPDAIPAPDEWPATDALDALDLASGMRRGADVVGPRMRAGEGAARARLDAFAADQIADYAIARDRPGEAGTSNLSDSLTLGEIGPATCWHAGWRAHEEGKSGAETWVKEVVWREFAVHLMHHTPRITDHNWRPEWDDFPWNEDEGTPEVLAWKQGRTGIPFVDAAMRQMHVTGRMHNRARMICASYLTKHLMTHWRIGQRFFADHLIDWDPASNAMGWQWVAGSGPDASPFFRVFNPDTQVEKFDATGAYRHAWIAEGQAKPAEGALAFYDAIPASWGLRPDMAYPDPIVTPAEGRERALSAYRDSRD
ncbi:MAG: cryptochrome/photolyase family protein [Paracoccaceae bacterium]